MIRHTLQKSRRLFQKDELSSLILRRGAKRGRSLLDQRWDCWALLPETGTGSIFDQFSEARRKALLVMATGTGRPDRYALDAKGKWVKESLVSCWPISLTAANAFKITDSSPVNLVSKRIRRRFYVCTYPTMMGHRWDRGRPSSRSLWSNNIDEVIAVYQKYQAFYYLIISWINRNKRSGW